MNGIRMASCALLFTATFLLMGDSALGASESAESKLAEAINLLEDAPQEAEKLLLEVVALCEEEGASRELSLSLLYLGSLWHGHGRAEEARTALERAYSLQETGSWDQLTLNVMQKLALLYGEIGGDRRAEDLLRSMVDRSRARINAERTVASKLSAASRAEALGAFLLDRLRLTEAENTYEYVLGLYEEAGESSGVALRVATLADISRRQGKIDEAEVRYARAIDLLGRDGGGIALARTLEGYAQILSLSGRESRADAARQRALAIWEDLGKQGATRGLLEFLKRYADHLEEVGSTSDAESLRRRAATIQSFESAREPSRTRTTITTFGEIETPR